MVFPASSEHVAPDAGASLEDWLTWMGSVHPDEIEFGLERVRRVAARLGIERPPLAVVIVGGTNGKGSTVRMLETIWTAAGHRVGASTSPHVVRFNERVRVNGEEASDAELTRALARVDAGRTAADGSVDTLTYFEFATLGAMVHFVETGCDVAVMEVGLGGRLDAVNLWDADCAVLASIALDHADWLGSDVGVIATEKAAIGRRGRPFVLGEPDPPATLAPFVDEAGFALVDVGGRPLDELPETSLPGDHQRRNAGCAMAVIERLDARLPTDPGTARAALGRVALTARFERRVVGETTVVLDVAHNPAAAAVLASTWRDRIGGDIRAIGVFAAFADKDIEGIVAALADTVLCWHCAALEGPRAAPPDELARRVRGGLRLARPAAIAASASGSPDGSVSEADEGADASGVPDGSGPGDDRRVDTFGTVAEALDRALVLAAERGVPVLVCGSFLTVAAAHAALGD